MQLGGMSQWRGAQKGVKQAKPTGVLNKDENAVVFAIIRPQDDENLEEVSCVPQGRLSCRDTMQKTYKIYWRCGCIALQRLLSLS